MNGIGCEWIAGGGIALITAFLAGRWSGNRSDRDRPDLSGLHRGQPAPPVTPTTAAADRLAQAPVLAGLAPEDRHAIAAAIAAGRKIEAIKLLREATGLGLRESKDAVEAMDG